MKAFQLSGGDQILLHGHLWTVDRVRVTRKNKVEVWVSRGQRSVKLPLFALEEEVPVPRRANEALTFDETPRPNHVHEWTTLWRHLGEGMRQDVHTHGCTDELCHHLLIGEGRECNGVLTNHAHEHAANLGAYAIRPPRGDTITKEEQVESTYDRSAPRQSVMPKVVAFLISHPNKNISLDTIVSETGFSEDQVRRVMSNIKAPSRNIALGRYIEVISPGVLWRYVPRDGVERALGEVRGMPRQPSTVGVSTVEVSTRPSPPPLPPLPDSPGDKLPPEPKPGPVEPVVPTPKELAGVRANPAVAGYTVVGKNKSGETVYRTPEGELGVLRWEAL